MKKRIVGLIGTALMVGSASGSYLEDLVTEKLQLEQQAAAAYRPSEEWHYIEVPKGTVEIDVSAYSDPHLLILPDKTASKRVNATVYGVINSKQQQLQDYRKIGLKQLEPRALEIGSTPCETIRIVSPKMAHHVWVGNGAPLQKLWRRTLKPEAFFYTEVWFPSLSSAGFSEAEKFNEIAAMHRKTLPVTPRKMAQFYATSCVGGLKQSAAKAAGEATRWADAEAVRELYQRDCLLAERIEQVEAIDPVAMRLAMEDLERKFPQRGLLQTTEKLLATVATRQGEVLAALRAGAASSVKRADDLLAECREILLANPLLDGVELLAVRRDIGSLNLRDHSLKLVEPGRPPSRGFGGEGRVLGVPSLATHTVLTTLQRSENDWNCDLVKLSNLRGDVAVDSLYRAPRADQLISNARLHWDGRRIAFTMGAQTEPMALYELDASTGDVSPLSPVGSKDHFVDSCYLPDGNLIVMSTAIMTSLPCEGGSHLLSNMYLLNPIDKSLRQLGLDQENSYHATVTEDGKVLYIRYEYTDTSHYFTRIVMTMNPDGTNQREIYGSNSVWPTSLFYPNPIPGQPNLFSAVVSGHHGASHMGQIVLFDLNKGRREAEGAVQFIGKKETPIEAVMVDRLYGEDYPKYMYPVPLDESYYVTMMKPSAFAAWGLYLVDRFDNKTLIYQPKTQFLAWPQVLTKKPLPPVVPTRVDPASKVSTLYIQDIYEGPGLAGIPRGTVKDLAIFAFHYGYQRAASHRYIGIESAWDARYLLGTVPVHEDGSASFKVPSLMPISLMPLDRDGAAVQKMRSWINPQPGEFLSCIGCHEPADHAPVNKQTIASHSAPSEIVPWLGSARPFAFVTEVQPILDRYCIACHDGSGAAVDLRNSFSRAEMLSSKKYSTAYEILQKYVRRNGPESDYALMVPTEWHVSSSSLIQMLKKGHHGVRLDDEAWRTLTMWIDLNIPFHAAFHPADFAPYGNQAAWRQKRLIEYAGLDWNPEVDYARRVDDVLGQCIKPVAPSAIPVAAAPPRLKGWPFAVKKPLKTLSLEFGEAGRQIISYDQNRHIQKTLNQPERLDFVRIPAGRYVMGAPGADRSAAPRVVSIAKPFWMSVSEISNSQMQTFDPLHDSRFADLPEKDQTARGVPLYTEDQPAVRVSHTQAVAFCEWLSQQSGKTVCLPTEEQWEWAARAGTQSDMWYGSQSTRFARFANLSDHAHRYKDSFRRKGVTEYYRFVDTVDDGHSVSAPVKSYEPNAWGLYDMIGNAEEWTATKGDDGKYVVKGGSWFDVPQEATSATRWAYDEYMRLPDLGFRVVIVE